MPHITRCFHKLCCIIFVCPHQCVLALLLLLYICWSFKLLKFRLTTFLVQSQGEMGSERARYQPALQPKACGRTTVLMMIWLKLYLHQMSVLTKLSLGHFWVETEAPNASLVSHRGDRHTRPEPCGAICTSPMCECVVLTRFYCTLDIKLAWSLV